MLKILFGYLKNGQLALLLTLSRMMTPFYKISFAAALIDTGLLETLSQGGTTLGTLLKTQGIAPKHSERMAAWLQMGERIHEISWEDDLYRLDGISARLAKANNDAFLAMVQEIATLHHKLILYTPQRLKQDQLWTLDDQEGELIARSSRISEPLQANLITETFPKTGEVRLLEIGCGSGIYLQHAAHHNPQLTALGLELQPEVAEMARQNIADWGLSDRIVIESGDVRQKSFSQEFDIVTLYNNIYYFSFAQRVTLLEHLRTFLKPGGFLVLVTGAQGGQPLMEFLNLWGATTEGCDRLPSKTEMAAQMQHAGFTNVQVKDLLPGDAFYGFIGYN